MDLIKVGQRIKECRKARQLTQEKLAELIDLSPHYIYEIERGTKTMSIYTLNDIATVLNISVDYLMYGKNNERISDIYSDKLQKIIESLPNRKRDAVADILDVMLKHIK